MFATLHRNSFLATPSTGGREPRKTTTRYHVAYRRLFCFCTPEAEQNETWRLRNLSESQSLLSALARSRGILSLQPLTTGGLDGENLYNRLPDPVERLERDALRPFCDTSSETGDTLPVCCAQRPLQFREAASREPLFSSEYSQKMEPLLCEARSRQIPSWLENDLQKRGFTDRKGTCRFFVPVHNRKNRTSQKRIKR